MKNVVVAIVLSVLAVSNVQAAIVGQSTHFDPAYSGNITHLFDQSTVIASQEFQQASEPEKHQMLVNEFEQRKNREYSEVLKSYWWLGVVGLAPVAYKLTNIRVAQEQRPAVGPAMLIVGGANFGLIVATLLQPMSYAIINPISNEIERFTATVKNYFSSKFRKISSYFSDASAKKYFSDELERLEHQWVIHKRNVSTALWASIENSISKARNSQNSFSGSTNRKSVDVPTLIQRAIAIPNNVQILNFDPDRISTEFKGYDLDSPDALLEFCFRFVSASRHNSPLSKIPLYFNGPAGVGKTEASRRLAQVLDVSIGEVSLEKVAHINDLIGWPKDHENSRPGLIAEAMIQANKDGKGSKNMLLVFDEADRMINQVKHGFSNELVPALLKLLEPKTKSYYSPYFETDVEISHVGFIIIGNSTLKDKALQNRMQEVAFRGFVPGYKIEFIRNNYLPSLIRDDFSHPDFGGSLTMTDEDMAFVERMTIDDKDPGFRTIFLNVRRFLEHKVLQKQFGRPGSQFKPIEFST